MYFETNNDLKMPDYSDGRVQCLKCGEEGDFTRFISVANTCDLCEANSPGCATCYIPEDTSVFTCTSCQVG
jgi:uncharacterized protein (DUF983 family)